MFNVFRVIACAAVLAQHSFIWSDMSDNFVGTGFITLLHLSRTCFFFLTGLVVCYAQVARPRSLVGFWRRRYWEIGVPYLAWTGIYLFFTLITVQASWGEAGAFLRHNLPLGYSQMYFVIVVFQFYLLFPLLLKLVRSSSRHGRLMAASFALALVLALLERYHAQLAPASDVTHAINSFWPISRDFLTYQEFFVAGMLVALHLEQVLDYVARRHRQILLVTAGVGVLEVLWYVTSVWSGSSLAQASDIYQPSAVVWSLAAIAGLFALSWWWDQRIGRRPGRIPLPSSAYLAGLTGGVFFAHTLFMNILQSALEMSGLSASLPWEMSVAILFVATAGAAAASIALVLRGPLRWVLGGPLRSAQRASYGVSPPISPPTPARCSCKGGSCSMTEGTSDRSVHPPLDSVSAGSCESKGEEA
jgi:peptidoglycan/LPS O-acetylase OafA/YrhL